MSEKVDEGEEIGGIRGSETVERIVGDAWKVDQEGNRGRM